MLVACTNNTQLDDYAVNTKSDVSSSKSKDDTSNSKGISKDKIKVGVLHLSDPEEGSGYTYTHDIGIQGMKQNLGLSDEQIVRKNNVSDSDDEEIKKAIKDCIDEGCNIIFTTSWGYMNRCSRFQRGLHFRLLPQGIPEPRYAIMRVMSHVFYMSCFT